MYGVYHSTRKEQILHGETKHEVVHQSIESIATSSAGKRQSKTFQTALFGQTWDSTSSVKREALINAPSQSRRCRLAGRRMLEYMISGSFLFKTSQRESLASRPNQTELSRAKRAARWLRA